MTSIPLAEYRIRLIVRLFLFFSTIYLFTKNLKITRYAFCSNDPINRIDPDGMDDYEINSTGKVVNRIENTERDAFFMVDKKGNRIEGKELSFAYGTVEIFNRSIPIKQKQLLIGTMSEAMTMGNNFLSSLPTIQQ
jgi:hypothetical protein